MGTEYLITLGPVASWAAMYRFSPSPSPCAAFGHHWHTPEETVSMPRPDHCASYPGIPFHLQKSIWFITAVRYVLVKEQHTGSSTQQLRLRTCTSRTSVAMPAAFILSPSRSRDRLPQSLPAVQLCRAVTAAGHLAGLHCARRSRSHHGSDLKQSLFSLFVEDGF